MAPKIKRNGKIDEEIEETFPASDPPSFMAGEVLGAPPGRKTFTRRKPAKKTRAAEKKKRPTKKKPAAKKKKRATEKRTSR